MVVRLGMLKSVKFLYEQAKTVRGWEISIFQHKKLVGPTFTFTIHFFSLHLNKYCAVFEQVIESYRMNRNLPRKSDWGLIL